ncbi:MAG: hypothetical protein M1436_04305 [Acidobacteria bacterium]|nr:hypothetical protein [Acidobacteriota bacterium]
MHSHAVVGEKEIAQTGNDDPDVAAFPAGVRGVSLPFWWERAVTAVGIAVSHGWPDLGILDSKHPCPGKWKVGNHVPDA